jgi:hypothetical protein
MSNCVECLTKRGFPVRIRSTKLQYKFNLIYLKSFSLKYERYKKLYKIIPIIVFI